MRAFAVLVILSLAAVGCAGSSSTSSTAPGPSTNPACASLAPPQMLYPVPGSTGVAPDGIYVEYGSLTTLQTAWSVPYLAAGNSVLSGGPWLAPSPGPTNPPGATPAPGEVYGVSSVSNLAAATTYTVTVTNVPCGGSFPLGTFTTK